MLGVFTSLNLIIPIYEVPALLVFDKNNSYAYRNLASILGKMGKKSDALKYLKLAYDIDPCDPHTLYGLSIAYQDLGDQHTLIGAARHGHI